MKTRVSSFAIAAILVASSALAAAAPPLAGEWNIAAKGSAGSSGELVFRVSTANGDDPVDVTVPVMMGAKEDTVARSIRRALESQLRSDRFAVRLGEGGNVLVSDPRGRPAFAMELVDANVQDLRVAVQSVTPAASPTVPPQSAPAEVEDTHRKPPASNAPANNAPGNSVPPPASVPPDSAITLPAPAPVPSPSMPVPSPPPAPSPTMPVPSPESPAPGSSPPAAPPPAPPPSQGPNGDGAAATMPPPAPGAGS